MDVRTKLLTLALTAAGIAAVTVAQAQPAPAPSAPPPAPAPTTTTDPNAQPAPPPADPNAPPAAPAPTTTTTAQPAPPPPGAPSATPQDPNAPPAPPPVAQPQPPPVMAPAPPPAPPAPPPAPPAAPEKPKGMTLLQRFAGSAIAWTHSASASIFGTVTAENYVEGFNGRIYRDSDFYSQTLTFVPGAFLYRDARHNVRISSVVAISTELTDADNTTYKYQPDLNNIPIRLTDTISLAAWGAGEGGTAAGAVARDPTLAGAAEYRTQAVVGGQVILPTSRAFGSGGLYLGTNLNVTLRQQIKLFGSSSDYLGNITVSLGEAWTHQFWRATTPVADNIDVPRQDAAFNAIESDQLRGAANVENRFAHSLSFFLPIYGDLQLNGSYTLINDLPFKQNGTDCEVRLATGCVDLDPSTSKMRALTSFDVSLYYQIINEVGVDIGYSNFNNQLGENGKYRNQLFSPASLYYADVIVFPQALISRLTAPPKPKNQTGSR